MGAPKTLGVPAVTQRALPTSVSVGVPQQLNGVYADAAQANVAPGGTRMVLVACPTCSWQCQAGFPANLGGVYTIQCPNCSSSFVMQIQPNACSTTVPSSTGAFPPVVATPLVGALPPVGALLPAAAPVAAPPLNPTPLPLPPLGSVPQLPSLANALNLQLAMQRQQVALSPLAVAVAVP